MPQDYTSKMAEAYVSEPSKEYIDECVKNSFEGGKDPQTDDNKDLRMMQEEWIKYGHKVFPSLIVNDVTFRGSMNPRNVIEAVCAGFDREPAPCRKFLKLENIELNNRTEGR